MQAHHVKIFSYTSEIREYLVPLDLPSISQVSRIGWYFCNVGSQPPRKSHFHSVSFLADLNENSISLSFVNQADTCVLWVNLLCSLGRGPDFKIRLATKNKMHFVSLFWWNHLYFQHNELEIKSVKLERSPKRLFQSQRKCMTTIGFPLVTYFGQI